MTDQSLSSKLILPMLLIGILLMTSCYSTYNTYKGNVHQQAIGQTKNEILRSYGVPEKTTDDAAGGSIMIYEKFTQTTTTNVGSATYRRSAIVGKEIYGNGGLIAGNLAQAGTIVSTNGISQTSTDKTFCYLFLNKDNVVYDFKTNYGAQYDQNRCFNKTITWVGVGVSALFLYPAIVTIPWAIIEQKKATKNGMICK